MVARLEDGEFFWREDQKLQIADLVAKLTNVTFHEKSALLLNTWIVRVSLPHHLLRKPTYLLRKSQLLTVLPKFTNLTFNRYGW